MLHSARTALSFEMRLIESKAGDARDAIKYTNDHLPLHCNRHIMQIVHGWYR
jgi:hypothetical protein